MSINHPRLFERWLAIEKEHGKPMSQILDQLNSAAGTNYKHNWPSVVASRNYELERCPIEVRRYMMRTVLPVELEKIGITLDDKTKELLILALT